MEDLLQRTIDIIIPIYHPAEDFSLLLKSLLHQSVMPQHIFLLQTINTGEVPFDAQTLLESAGEKMDAGNPLLSVHPIQKEEFDHGATRAYGVGLSEADFFLMMTQDAMPADDTLLEQLLKGFEKEHVGIAYARQLPRKDSDILEIMAREHNYPAESMRKTRADEERLGIQAYFCSDVCAMYDRTIYEDLGGFSYPLIFNEDMIMAYRVIQAGYAVYYAAQAQVIHSHSYNCKQQFTRSFDLGVSQRQYSEIFDSISSEKEGAGFARKTIFTLIKKLHFWKAFYFCLQCGFRLIGYRLGRNYDRLPRSIILRCTMNKDFWKEG